ncbi:MAG: hypothetical protein ABI895_07410 [Deltaproteobacteria bacterium]
MNVILRRIIRQGVGLGSVMLLSAVSAHAQPKARAGAQCAERQKRLQALEQSGHLREARDVARECSQAACGELVSQQCRTRHQILEEGIPSVVPMAVDEQGAPLVEVEVRVDGTLSSTRIDGQGLALDPGLHEFSFSAKDRAPYVEKILIAQGERNRRISAVLRPASSEPATGGDQAAPAVAPPQGSSAAPPAATPHAAAVSVAEPSRHASVWPYVVGGAGLAALGASVAFATWGHTDFELLDRCAPNCKQDSVDHVTHMYIAADISLGVGVVALGAATWMYLSTPKSAEPRADQAGNHFDLRPAPGGAFATWEHAF